MTNEELKEAMRSRQPVVLRNPQLGAIRYKQINAIRYQYNCGRLIVSAELLDYNNNSITVARAKNIFIDEAAKEETNA